MYDFAEIIKNHDCFWSGNLGRPLVSLAVELDHQKVYTNYSLNDYDKTDLYLKVIEEGLSNYRFFGDSLPSVFPNIGPDFFPVCFGGKLNFAQTTSHSVPFLKTIEEAKNLQVDFDNVYFKIMDGLFNLLLPLSKDKFLVQMPDLHPGADCLVAWRGPAELCMDLIDNPMAVVAGLKNITPQYQKVYEHFWRRLKSSGLPCSSWANLYSTTPYGVPSCDFSYMISPKEFQGLILESLIDECKLFSRNIFHVDGKGVLNHLDAILTLPNLQVIQWVYGAGNGAAKDWIEIYKKCLTAGKSVQVFTSPDDLDMIFAQLEPNNIHLMLSGVNSCDEAEHYLRRVKNWK